MLGPGLKGNQRFGSLRNVVFVWFKEESVTTGMIDSFCLGP